MYHRLSRGAQSAHAGMMARGVARRSIVAILSLCALATVPALSSIAYASPHTVVSPAPMQGGDIIGQVVQTPGNQPIGSAEVRVLQAGQVVYKTSTDDFGRFTAHNLDAGQYIVTVQVIGFRRGVDTVTVTGTRAVHADFKLVPAATALEATEIQTSVPLTVDTRTGNQQFKQDRYHGAPSTTTSQILQQSVAGAVRAPTGEVHIRGQHAEYTYYLDGVPVPAGISGSLNELFDPSVLNQMSLITGAWDAEYGGKNAAVVDVSTRIPTGHFHANLSGYGGNYSANGQSLNLSGNSGKFGYFLSGSRQATDMRQEPVLFDTLSKAPINFNNHGEDVFGFGKLQYTPGANDVMTLESNWGRTRLQVPYDSTGGTFLDDHQQDINGFVNAGWRHRFSNADHPELTNELFTGLFYRYGTLRYTPSPNDDPQFIFYPDTTNPYNLREDRNFNTIGLKLDYTYHVRHGLEFKVGTMSSITRGHEDFVTEDASGQAGPASNSNLSGHDIGVYAQTAYSPVEQFEIRTGLRYDTHKAPFASAQSQLSPRIRLNFFPNATNTFYLYYGRQFIPTNVEDLRAITSVAQAGVATDPTLPERDHFYEAGYLHRFPHGIVAKAAAYHKQSSPGVDDNTVPGSSIVTDVNIADVRVTGLEGVLEVNPDAPLSGYLNLALNHAYGRGPITGGFFPEDTPDGVFDLDHDQRLSGVASLTYTMGQLYVSGTGIYGSGLTNGVEPEDCDCSVGTGLFDFNRGIHVSPSFIANLSAGYSFAFGQTLVRPELFVDNIFDKHYLLKGAFFSGASVGRPRSVQFRVNVGI